MTDKRTFVVKNPDWLSSKLLAARLRLNLPVLTGDVSLESLKNEIVRRSVSAYFHMILHQQMPNEPVHFGVASSAQYSMLLLCATQKKDEFDISFSYVLKGMNVIVQDINLEEFILPMKMDELEVHVVDVVDDDVVSLRTMEFSDLVVDLIVPEMHSFVVCNSIDVTLDMSLQGDIERDKVVVLSGTRSIGEMFSVVIPDASYLWDLEKDVIGNRQTIVTANFQNLEVSQRIRDECNNGLDVLRCKVKKTGHWSLRINYKITYYRIGSYVLKDPTPYTQKLEKKMRNYFRTLVEGLKKLPYTKLVYHNIVALQCYRFPMRMPNPWLLNQVLNMLGRRWEMSSWYLWFLERWDAVAQYDDWDNDIQKMIRNRVSAHYVAQHLQVVPRKKVLLTRDPLMREHVSSFGITTEYVDYCTYIREYVGVFQSKVNYSERIESMFGKCLYGDDYYVEENDLEKKYEEYADDPPELAFSSDED